MPVVWLVADEESETLKVRVGVAGAVPVQEKTKLWVLPLLLLETLTQVPEVVLRCQLVMSLAPSASSADAVTLNWCEVALSW